MKKIKFACNLSLLTLFALGQWACEWDPYEHDSDPVRETLELTASASQIALDENDLSATVLTFDWTPARPMPDEYLVSYTTKLDLLNNNFGSSTAIVTSEDDGIFSRSYTSEQINNWANERWKVPVNKTFTLAFRVIAEYAGGPTYEMPEVRTVEVTVTPIKVDVFDADKVSLSGTAISSVTEIEKTVENANLYAWYGELSIGELQIPVELEGQTYYIVPSDGNGAAPRRGACRREDDGNPRFVEYPERRQLPPADRHGEEAGAHLLSGDRSEAAVGNVPSDWGCFQSRSDNSGNRCSVPVRRRHRLGNERGYFRAKYGRSADTGLRCCEA